MQSTFTEAERFVRTLTLQPVDRPPLMPDGPWADTWARWHSEGLPEHVNSQAALFEYLGAPCEPLTMEYCGVESLFHPWYKAEVLEETEEYVIRRRAEGVVLKEFRNTTTMPVWLDFPIKGPEDVRDLLNRLDPDDPTRWPEDWEARVERWRGDRGNKLVLANGGQYFGQLRNMMGLERISIAYMDYPDLMMRLRDRMEYCLLTILGRVLEDVEVDYVGFSEDIAYKTGTLVSPDIMRRYVYPGYRAATELALAKSSCRLFITDSDGNLRGVLGEWLETGVNTFLPIEVAAEMDPVALRREHGMGLRMIGGIDKRAVANGPDAIRRELYETIPPLLEQGGYIPQIDHSVSADISLANYITYFNLRREILERHARS